MQKNYANTTAETKLNRQPKGKFPVAISVFAFAKTPSFQKNRLGFLLVMFLAISSMSWSQAPNIAWQKALGGSSYDQANSIQQTSDGGYIVAGFSESNDGDMSGNHGGNDYWVVKLNAAGNLVWQKSLGGSGDDVANSIQQTKDGGYVVAGYSNSNDGDVSGNHGLYDYWIVKLDGAGNLQWQKSLGGSGDDQARSIQQTSDGGYIVAGYSGSNNGNVSGNHGDDYWVVKLDVSGNIVWQKALGGDYYEYGYSIQQTSDGGYIVAGESSSSNGDVSGNHGNSDYWIVKLDGSGNIVWQKSLGGSNYDYPYSIQQTKDGGYVVAGYSYSNNGDINGNHGNSDCWVVKLDGAGNLQWQKALGGNSYDLATSIQQTSDGGYIMAGISSSNNGNVSGNHGGSDYWVVKLNSTGNIIWQKALGGSSTDQAHSIQQTKDGGYVVAGLSISNNGDINGNHGNYDYWVVKLTYDSNSDSDGDGDPNNTDCAPDNPAIHHGATEIPDDGIDQDCDGFDLKTWYQDRDGDGYGNPALTKTANTQPTGYVADHTDCNDDPNNGGANEHPNQTWYIDNDGDGYGTGAKMVQCSRPQHGYLASELKVTSGDCNDNDASVRAMQTYYKDADGDGYDGGSAIFCSSTPPSGYKATTLGPDCNDNDATVHSPQTYYRDADGDGFGNPGVTTTVCSSTPPQGYVSNNQDCNDSDDDINPETNWWRDDDGDGYGNPNIMFMGCTPPTGYNWVMNNYDCDDYKKDTKHPENNDVLMCHDGHQECVKVKDVQKKQSQGWVLGPCAPPCKDNKVLMCHNGKLHCVNQKDVRKNLSKKGWSLGYCGATSNALTQLKTVSPQTEVQALGDKFTLASYPNPFGKSTRIEYTVPVDSKVSIKVFDLMGREVGVIFTGERAAGSYNVDYNTSKLSSGVYYARMIATAKGQSFMQTQKLVKAD